MGPQPKRCHHCKSSDHLIADCPMREEKRSKSKPLNGDVDDNCKESNHTSETGSEEDCILNATETASSSSEKHLSDSGITRSTGKTPTTDDTKSETSATSDGSRGRDV